MISLGQIISLYVATVTLRLKQFKMKSIYRSKPKAILPEGILLEMNVQLNNWTEKCFTNANETIKMVRMVHASQTSFSLSLSLSVVKSFFNFCQKFSWIWSRHLKWKSRFGLNTIRFKPQTFKNPPINWTLSVYAKLGKTFYISIYEIALHSQLILIYHLIINQCDFFLAQITGASSFRKCIMSYCFYVLVLDSIKTSDDY